MLRVDQIRVVFDGRAVVDGVDLEVGDGEKVAVLGPSGCGKTTLLRAIAGLEPLVSGRVWWDGDDITALAPHRRRFGLMFQEYALFPHRDVAGNVAFGLRMHDRGAKVDHDARVREVLDLVGLGDLAERRVAALSGGEQQRVALARALAATPRLLMLDEPLGALDRLWRERLLVDLRMLLDAARLPAIYVTHDHEEAFALADRILLMRAGRIVQSGAPAAVWERPVDAWAAGFLGFGPAVRGDARADGLHTPWGQLPTSTPVAPGTVTVVLRPDALRLGDGPVRGRVMRITFAGDRVECIIDAGGPPLRIRVAPQEAPTAGADVSLTVDPDAVLVYPE